MKQILSFFIVLLLVNNVNAQQLFPIKGIVKSGTGQQLAGVSLTVKGTKIGGVTDKEGKFSFSVPANSTIIISHVGYQSKKIRTDSTQSKPFTIVLNETVLAMNDVVISTGYQQLNKERSTGSFEKIDNHLFNRSTGTSILSRMDGIAGSLFFDHKQGSTTPIQIRGLSTLTWEASSPLVILDNFPYEGDLNNINPNDIESITILKDAAAASIWGAKAGNGVIVITTKKGQFNQAPKISLSTDMILTGKPHLFDQKNMSTSDFIDVEQFLFSKGYYNSSLNNRRNFPPLSPVVEILAKQKSGSITKENADAQINGLRSIDVRNGFEKYLYRQGVTQQYSLNFSGGSRLFNYIVSGGYDRNLSTLVGNKDDRITIRSNSTFNPAKNIQLSAAVNYTKSSFINNSPGGYNQITIGKTGAVLYPYTQFVDASGNLIPIDYYYRGVFTDTAGNGKLLDWKYNPLDELNNVSRSTITNAFLADIGLRINISKALNAEVKYQYQNSQDNSSNIFSVNSFMARNLINQFTQYDGTNITYILPYGGILDAGFNNLNGYALRGQLSFNKSINRKNSINAIGGAEIRQTSFTANNYRTYGYNKTLNASAVDYTNYYPSFDNVAGKASIPFVDGFSSTLDRYVSIYANAAYTYDKRYTLSSSIRKDASNLFGVKSNQKGVPLWSSGIAWNISNEIFYHFSVFPILKFRATYGFGGNVSHSVSALTTLWYSPAAYQPINNLPYANIKNFPNPNLQWEKVGMMNIGIDFGSRNNRITGSIEYYQKNSSDLLGNHTLDPTLGTSFLFDNSANMKGHGVDVVINSRNIITKNFRWETSFLYSSVKNKIVKYLHESNTKGYTSDGADISPLQGYTPFLIVSYKWGGLDSLGNPVGYLNGKKSNDYNSLRKISFDQQVINGPAIPQYFGAMTNTFSWKELSISANITYRLGYYFRKPSLNYADLFKYGKGNVEFKQRWQKPGDENITNVPSLRYPLNINRETFYHYSEINVGKADNIRLNDVRLSYQFSREHLKKVSIDNLELFAYFSNLNVLIWKANKFGLDPEFPSGLKTPMSASFGLRTNF